MAALDDVIANFKKDAPNVDAEKGSVYDILKTIAREHELFMSEALHLKRQFSSDYALEMSDHEIYSYANQLGHTIPTGKKSRGDVCFCFGSLPSGVLNIGEEIQATTDDGKYVYLVTNPVRLSSDSIAPYYNNTERMYIVPVEFEALEIGEDYNIAAHRVTAFSGYVGADIIKVFNPQPMIGGTNRSSITEVASVINTQITDTGFMDAFKRDITNNALVHDAQLLPTFNQREPFRTYRSALDIYIIGESVSEYLDIYLADRSENNQEFKLTSSPVKEILEVSVNGVILEKDEYIPMINAVPSSWDKSSIIIRNFVRTGSNISVRYTYNGLLEDLEKNYTTEDNDFCGVNSRFREAVNVALGITVSGTILSTLSYVSAETAINRLLEEMINTNKFVEYISVKELQDYVKKNSSGFSKLSVDYIYRVNDLYKKYYDVIYFQSGEYPTVKAKDIEKLI